MYSSAAKKVPPSRLVVTSLSSTATRVVLPIPAPADDTADAFIDNYEMDVESNKSENFTLSQKMVHYVGGQIMKEHWSACKAVLAFHAGATTSKLPAMTKAKKEEACLEYYEAAIAALDPAFFNMQLRIFFGHGFRKPSEHLNGESLYRYYTDSRCTIRCKMLPLFPTNLVSMKSRRGFTIFTQQFHLELLKTRAKESQST